MTTSSGHITLPYSTEGWRQGRVLVLFVFASLATSPVLGTQKAHKKMFVESTESDTCFSTKDLNRFGLKEEKDND